MSSQIDFVNNKKPSYNQHLTSNVVGNFRPPKLGGNRPLLTIACLITLEEVSKFSDPIKKGSQLLSWDPFLINNDGLNLLI
jgi:hypothetical protein